MVFLAMFTGIGALQVLWAVSWAVQNGNNVQGFYDTGIYMSSAETLVGDGWRLMGYACLLRFFMFFKTLLGENYVWLLYITQISCSLLVLTKCIKCVAEVMYKRKLRFAEAFVPAVYLVTIPIVWQIQFAVLPDALCLSLLVWLFMILTRIVFQNYNLRWYDYFSLTGILLLLGVMHRAYFYASLALVVFACMVCLIRICTTEKTKFLSFAKKMTILLAIGCMSAGVCGLVNDAVPKSEEYVEYSFGAALGARFVYPYMADYYLYYSEQITEAISWEQMYMYNQQYEDYITDIGLLLWENNPENVQSAYLEMAKICFGMNKSRIIKDTCKEFAAYLLTPVAMEKFMYGNGNSLYGYNVSRMYEKAPALTMNYVHGGMNGVLAIVVLGGLLFVLKWFSGEEKKKTLSLAVWGVSFASIVIIPQLLFSIRKFDYRIGMISIFVMIIYIFSIGCVHQEE